MALFRSLSNYSDLLSFFLKQKLNDDHIYLNAVHIRMRNKQAIKSQQLTNNKQRHISTGKNLKKKNS